MDNGHEWDLSAYRESSTAEASELGKSLDEHHAVANSHQPSPALTCGICGFLIYEPTESIWWHLPAPAEFAIVRSWLGSNQA